VDPRGTQQKPDRKLRGHHSILNRLPLYLHGHRRYWLTRNILRNEDNYQFEPLGKASSHDNHRDEMPLPQKKQSRRP
jgi:hypothetical protein